MRRHIIQFFTLTFFILFFQTSCSLQLGLGYDDETINRTIKTTYKEILFDDFNGSELDSTKWNRTVPHKKGNYGYWIDGCSYVQNGNLILAEKEAIVDIPNDINYGKNALCSGAIDSKLCKNDFNQGLYEIRFKITNPVKGVIYAFWFLNDEMGINGSNDGTEIDFFEVVPNEKFISTSVHYGNYFNNLHSKGKTMEIYDDFYNKYHILQFFWDKYCYEVYLDGTFIYRLETVDCGGKRKAPGYLRISAEYGVWNRKNFVPETPSQPSLFCIDYVKVYEKK